MFTQLRVLELASVLAGPSVGQFFAELGATVIKVENLKTGGDVTRSWKSAREQTDDRSAYFCSVNWGKKSVALDLETTIGKNAVAKLAESSDIVIASYKPGDAEKLGVDYESLRKRNPKLIYGQVTGYGPQNKRVGYDAVIQAEAGFMYMNGEPGGASLKMPVAFVDILAAHHLKEAILIALLNRERNDTGAFVEVSLFDAAVSSLANQATNWLVSGILPGKQGSAHPNIAPYGDVFSTADGKEVLLAVGTDKQFTELCGLLDLHHLVSDSSYINNRARVVNRASLGEQLSASISRLSATEFIDKCHQSNVPAGVVQSMQEVFELPEARRLLLTSNGLSGVRSFASNMDSSNISPPPHFGEHTVSVLNELGF